MNVITSEVNYVDTRGECNNNNTNTNKKIRTAHIRGSFLHLQIDCVQTRNDFLQSLFLCMFHPPLYPAFCDGIEQNQQTKTV